MSVESILRKKGTDVATIAPDVSVKRAADWLHAKNIGALVVTRGNAFLVSFPNARSFTRFPLRRDRHLDACERNHATWRDHRSPAETVSHAMNLMTRHRVRHMPVVHDGKLAGIISIGDVVKHRLDDLELETHVLRDARVAAR